MNDDEIISLFYKMHQLLGGAEIRILLRWGALVDNKRRWIEHKHGSSFKLAVKTANKIHDGYRKEDDKIQIITEIFWRSGRRTTDLSGSDIVDMTKCHLDAEGHWHIGV